MTVVVIGLGKKHNRAILFETLNGKTPSRREVDNICPYLVPYRNIVIEASTRELSPISEMVNGSKPADGGNLILNFEDAEAMRESDVRAANYIRRFVGSKDSIHGIQRFCLWIQDDEELDACQAEKVAERIERVKEMRRNSSKALMQRGVSTPHAFQQIRQTGDEVLFLSLIRKKLQRNI